jgi:post-segregation antitoxin (ccd killing protein)
MTKRKIMSVALPGELAAFIEDRARAEGVPVSALLRRAIEAFYTGSAERRHATFPWQSRPAA